MRFRLIAGVAVLACAVASGSLRAAATPGQNWSHAELKRVMQNAHTTEDYLGLASYFRWRQQEFEQKAHDELVFWAQRSMNVALEAAKYPRPADSSKNRYDYFVYEAQKMSAQADRYQSLSESGNR